LLTLSFLICADQHELHIEAGTNAYQQGSVFNEYDVYGCDRLTFIIIGGSIKTSNICCGAGISSGGAGISSGGRDFLLVTLEFFWLGLGLGGAGITSGGFSDSDSHFKCMH